MIFGCSKSYKLTARETLLTNASWKLQRIDSFMYNADTIIRLGSSYENCNSYHVMTCNENGSATYQDLCLVPPAIYGGGWMIIQDSVFVRNSENEPQKYYDTIRVLTADTLTLQLSSWFVMLPNYTYPYHLQYVYSH